LKKLFRKAYIGKADFVINGILLRGLSC